MKSFITLALIASATLLISTTAEAKRYGGFKVGDRFQMKVVSVESTSQTGYSGTPAPAAIHSQAAKYRKGQVLKFRIKARGRLTAKGIRIAFAHASRKEVEFNSSTPGTVAVTQNAAILMKKGKPSRCTISIFISDTSGVDPVNSTVVYMLK